MNNCTDCKGNILNQTVSLIGSTRCTGDCPEEMNCADGIYASNCIFYSGANLECSGILFGDSLSTAFNKLDALLCESAGCKVKVSSTDACCEFLESKITAGTGITITKETVLTCEKLVISTNPAALTWSNISLPPTLATITSYQIPQFSNKDELGRIWFRGSFTFAQSLAVGAIISLSTALPANNRPLNTRTLFNGKGSTNGTSSPQLIFLTSGVIQVKNTTDVPCNNKGIVSFDGFWLDVNS